MRNLTTSADMERACVAMTNRLARGKVLIDEALAHTLTALLAAPFTRDGLLVAADEAVLLLHGRNLPASKDLVLEAAAALWGENDWNALSVALKARDAQGPKAESATLDKKSEGTDAGVLSSEISKARFKKAFFPEFPTSRFWTVSDFQLRCGLLKNRKNEVSVALDVAGHPLDDIQLSGLVHLFADVFNVKSLHRTMQDFVNSRIRRGLSEIPEEVLRQGIAALWGATDWEALLLGMSEICVRPAVNYAHDRGVPFVSVDVAPRVGKLSGTRLKKTWKTIAHAFEAEALRMRVSLPTWHHIAPMEHIPAGPDIGWSARADHVEWKFINSETEAKKNVLRDVRLRMGLSAPEFRRDEIPERDLAGALSALKFAGANNTDVKVCLIHLHGETGNSLAYGSLRFSVLPRCLDVEACLISCLPEDVSQVTLDDTTTVPDLIAAPREAFPIPVHAVTLLTQGAGKKALRQHICLMAVLNALQENTQGKALSYVFQPNESLMEYEHELVEGLRYRFGLPALTTTPSSLREGLDDVSRLLGRPWPVRMTTITSNAGSSFRVVAFLPLDFDANVCMREAGFDVAPPSRYPRD